MDNTSKYYQRLADIQQSATELTVSKMFMIMRDLVDEAEQAAQAPVVADLNLLIASKKLTDIYNKSPENAEDFIEAIENAFINFEAVVEAELNSGVDKVTLRAMLKESKS